MTQSRMEIRSFVKFFDGFAYYETQSRMEIRSFVKFFDGFAYYEF